MATYKIQGGKSLSGTVRAIGNKNAVLKMIAASLLTAEPVTITNVPAISDVAVMLRIAETLGTKATYDADAETVTLHTPTVTGTSISGQEAKKLRASNVFLGPLLAREGHVDSVLPGGDKIGPREMTAHFDGFQQLGITTTVTGDDSFSLSGKPAGADVFLYEPSVTATENVIMAAVLATGSSTIRNAASEPHVQELCRMLVSMGAKITGIGTNTLHIDGVETLSGTTVAVPPDYIYVGTFIVLAAITNGDLTITDVHHDDLRNMLHLFGKLGVTTEVVDETTLRVPPEQVLAVTDQSWARIKGIYSQPWPCFPSDMMSLAIVLATQVEGSTLFFEKMYSGRMFFADYLNGMGANIVISDPHRVVVNGVTPLHGRTLASPDLRAGMAYVAAGLCASGTTTVENIRHIDRGYPHLESILQELGADITRIE